MQRHVQGIDTADPRHGPPREAGIDTGSRVFVKSGTLRFPYQELTFDANTEGTLALWTNNA